MRKPSIRIWQRAGWPALTLDAEALTDDLALAYRMHGVIEGEAPAIGLTNTNELALDAVADEVVATATIDSGSTGNSPMAPP
jgi:hypothetical protein